MNTTKRTLLKITIIILSLQLFTSCKKDKKEDAAPSTPVTESSSLLVSYDFSNNLKDGSGNDLHINSASSPNYGFCQDRSNNTNSAIELVGNGYLRMPASQKYKPEFPFTVSMWAYLVDGASLNNRFIYSDDNSIYYGYWIQTTGTNGAIACNFGDGTGASEYSRKSAISYMTLPNNTWKHITAVFNSANNIEIYIDGVKDTNVSYSGYATEIAYSNVAGVIGKSGGGSSYINGRIDRVRVWNKALTASQVNNEYTSTK